jgi:hypothetical protein
MLTEYPLFARLSGDVVAVVRFDGTGFSVEVGVEGDPESFDAIENHADLVDAAIALVAVIKHSTVVNQDDVEAVTMEL